MLEYEGKFGKAKIMLDDLGQDGSNLIKQIYEFLNHEAFTNDISIMPDTHPGKGAVIGFTMKLTNKVIPNVIGVDIGCGMLSFNLTQITFDPKEFDEQIRERIPFSTNVHKNKREITSEFYIHTTKAIFNFTKKFNKEFKTSYLPVKINIEWLKNKCSQINMDYDRTINSLGTLGGGNHFIEIGIDDKDDIWGTIHSGSRQFGLKIANYHQRKAGKGQLAFLEGEEMFDYLTDMVVAQTYAHFNRTIMLNEITSIFNYKPEITIESVHNYIDFNDLIIRKGAISSYENEKMIIPFNMEDGILICEGKSNPNWNYSAPHGAGRVGSRRWAKENLNLDEAKKNMNEKGIYTSKLPLDECKQAYKDPKIIEKAIEPTAKIITRLKPVLSCKGD